MLNQPTSNRQLDIEDENKNFAHIETKLVKWTRVEKGVVQFKNIIIRKLEKKYDVYGRTTMYEVCVIEDGTELDQDEFYKLRNAKAYALENFLQQEYEQAIEMAKESSALKSAKIQKLEELEKEAEKLDNLAYNERNRLTPKERAVNSQDYATRYHTERRHEDKALGYQEQYVDTLAKIIEVRRELNLSFLDAEILYNTQWLKLIEAKLTFHNLWEDAKKFKSVNVNLNRLKKRKGMKVLSKQDNSAPLTFESVCPWGKHKGTIIDRVPNEWLLEVYEQYYNTEILENDLKRLVDFIEDKIDIIAETC